MNASPGCPGEGVALAAEHGAHDEGVFFAVFGHREVGVLAEADGERPVVGACEQALVLSGLGVRVVRDEAQLIAQPHARLGHGGERLPLHVDCPLGLRRVRADQGDGGGERLALTQMLPAKEVPAAIGGYGYRAVALRYAAEQSPGLADRLSGDGLVAEADGVVRGVVA